MTVTFEVAVTWSWHCWSLAACLSQRLAPAIVTRPILHPDAGTGDSGSHGHERIRLATLDSDRCRRSDGQSMYDLGFVDVSSGGVRRTGQQLIARVKNELTSALHTNARANGTLSVAARVIWYNGMAMWVKYTARVGKFPQVDRSNVTIATHNCTRQKCYLSSRQLSV